MPKEKESIKCIAKIYKRNYENLGMFFWVEAQKQLVPTITIAQAIKSYYSFIRECYDLQVAVVIYSNIKAELIDLNYENTKKNS